MEDSDSDNNFDDIDAIDDGELKETPGGEQFLIKVIENDSMESSYNVTLSDKIGDLISRYIEDKGFAKDFPIQFTLNGKVLDKNKTLLEQNITAEDKLKVEAIKEDPIPPPKPEIVIPPPKPEPQPVQMPAQEQVIKQPQPQPQPDVPQKDLEIAQPIYQSKVADIVPNPEKPKQVVVNYYESDEDDDFNDNDNDDDGEFYLRVKGTDGETVDIRCKPNDTLSTVKDKYYEERNISGSQNSVPYFSFQGKNLNLYKKINEIDGLNKGAVLNYYQRLKGGLLSII